MRTKEQNREYMKKYRKTVTSDVTPDTGDAVTSVTPDTMLQDVTEKVTQTPKVTGNIGKMLPVLPEGWDHVRDYISTPGNPDKCGASGLARMRAVCGSLGRNAGSVRFGAYGPTAQEIGKVIGMGGPIVTPASPPARYMPPMISVHDLLARAAHGGRA